jgi:hypothetical protein
MVLICLKTKTPYPPPFTHVYVYTVDLLTPGMGVGEES